MKVWQLIEQEGCCLEIAWLPGVVLCLIFHALFLYGLKRYWLTQKDAGPVLANARLSYVWPGVC